jgi:hypothetical protein
MYATIAPGLKILRTGCRRRSLRGSNANAASAPAYGRPATRHRKLTVTLSQEPESLLHFANRAHTETLTALPGT